MIGCCYWGPNLIRNFHGLPNAKVKTVSDLRSGRLDYIKENYPDINTTEDFNDIISDSEIDAIVIVTPVTTHRELAELALKAGKHTFVEKPLAHTSKDAWDLVEIAKINNKILGVGHTFQFTPGTRRIRRELESGKIGKVFHFSSTRINLGPPKTTVDVVWDLCPHDLSIILHLFNEMPVKVDASGTSFQWKGFIDNAHINLEFSGNKTAHIHLSWLSANKTRLIQIFGENGSIVYDEMLAPDGKVKLYDKGIDNRINSKDHEVLAYSAGDIHVLALEQHEPLRLECSEFVNAIQKGTDIPNNGVIGAQVVELLELISKKIEFNNL